jgi:RNA polymerase sigma-70 factor (ECF subfamily)
MLDRQTFEQLFKSEFKGLVFFAIQYVKDMDTAKEIVQDAFLSLWQKREVIDLTKPVKSYLTTSVRNKCLNHLRDSKKFSDEVIDMEDIRAEKHTSYPDKLVEAELKQRIESAIEELPEKCREVFLLSRHENLKYQEIAERLELSVKTVEAQMSKALQYMRKRLEEFLI